MNVVILLVVFFLSGLVQGATGFGSGLLALGLLVLFGSPIKDVSVILVLPSLFVSLSLLWRLWREFRGDRIVPLLVAAVLAVPAGVFLLRESAPHTLYLILGLLLIASVVQRAIPRLARRRWHPVWMGVPCGLLSGVLAGALNTGGPPVVAFTSTQRFGRHRYAAVLQVAFVVFSLTRLLILTATGMFTLERLWLSACGIPMAVVGALLGLRVLSKLSDEWLGRIVAAALLLLGVRYTYLAFAC